MFRHVIVVLLTLSIIMGSVLAGSLDPQPQTKEERKAANAAAKAEREQKRLQMRKEIKFLKELNRNLTKQLNEKTKLLETCNEIPAAAGTDQDELNTLKDQLAAVQAQNQKLTADLQQCGETESVGESPTAAPARETTESVGESSTAAPARETTESVGESSTTAPAEETTESVGESSGAAPAEETTESVGESSTAAPAVETTESVGESSTTAPARETTESVEKSKCQAPLTNVALNKPATQSSTNENRSAAQKAVDGSRDSYHVRSHSCAITNPSVQGAWWQVDLGRLYYVDSVFITNRYNPFNQTRDYEIRVYTEDPTSSTSDTGALCFRYDGKMRFSETVRLNCQSGPIKGRYVRIINSPNNNLTLCEVEVMALGIDAASETCPADEIPENVASGKTATMSSLWQPLHKVSNALDNNFSPYPTRSYSSCAITENDTVGPWWQVDLGQNYKVHYVVIGNRSPELDRILTDFSIKVYQEDPSDNPDATATLCKFHPGSVGDAATISLACDDEPAEGRYVRITNAPGKNLQLCEVEVFATEV